MKLTVRLFVQRLADNTYLVSAPLVPGVTAAGPSLERCKQKMARALAKRLAAAEPYERDGVAADPDERLEPFEVTLQPHAGEDGRASPVRLAINLLLHPDTSGGLGVTMPRLTDPAIFFHVDGPSQLQAVAASHLILYFQDYVAERIERFQPSPEETIDEVEVEVELKPQSARGSPSCRIEAREGGAVRARNGRH